jgi:(R,R)-butanediol dehydrogenase/meso-butanediol dehydrogenase/diacetyl reductase
MKAVVCYSSGRPLTLEDRPDPSPGPGEVVLRVERCGICGSELHLNDGPPREFPGGMVMGHEFAGEIVALGSGVSGLRIGQRVAAYPAVGCGNCAACAVGNQILCQTAPRVLGGFAEYAVIPAAAAIPLPDELTPALWRPPGGAPSGCASARARRGDDCALGDFLGAPAGRW